MTLASKFTVARTILAPLFVVIATMAFPHWNIWAAIIFILASVTDMVDGQIARKYNQISDFGKLVDPIADKFLLSAAMLVLVQWGKFPSWVAMIVITRDIIVSAFRITAANHGLVIAARNSGKIKTVLQMIAYSAYLFEFDTIGLVFLIGGTVTTVWSLIDYVYANRHILTARTTVPFLFSFVDKLLTTYAIFYLVGSGALSALFGMIFIGRDNIVSGVKVMASSHHTPIPLLFSGVLRSILQIAFFLAMLLGLSMDTLLGQACLGIVVLVTVWSCLDVCSYQSRHRRTGRVQ